MRGKAKDDVVEICLDKFSTVMELIEVAADKRDVDDAGEEVRIGTELDVRVIMFQLHHHPAQNRRYARLRQLAFD